MCRTKSKIHAATKVARISDHKFQIGAIVAQGSRIVSCGVNRYKTHPEQLNCYTGEYGGSIHAELDAVLRCPHNAAVGSTVYVARVSKSGVPLLAKPCASCIKVLSAAGVRRVVFTTDNGYLVEMLGE